MRIEQVVSELCKGNDKFRRKIEYLSQATGGWERWFQLEMAYYIYEQFHLTYDINLEDSTVYSGGAYRADITLTSKTPHRMNTIVELKCQVAGTSASAFAQLIERDIQKALHAADGWDYEVIAITQSSDDMESALEYLTARFKTKVSGRNFVNLDCPGAFIHFFQGAV